MSQKDMHSSRLSDRIFCALELAIEQGDLAVAENLLSALELSMTRTAGGGEFVERRNYPAELVEIQDRFDVLKKKSLPMEVAV